MEFHEKLQILRKERGLTQDDLAKELYVSRTAVSKWESGRGYPSIDSLKEISSYFSVTIDELLSGEKLLSIAEKENKSNLRNICDLMIGMIDLGAILLIVLPLYPNVINESIYSVNLFNYISVTSFNYIVYWMMFLALIITGIAKIVFAKSELFNCNKVMSGISMGIGSVVVLFLGITREAYAVTMAFLLLMIKGIILSKYIKI